VACRFGRSTAAPMTACVEDIKPTSLARISGESRWRFPS
jgi:hypothetical protein